MSNLLETRLAEARERLVIPGNASQGMQHNGFDVSTRRLLQGLASDASFVGFDNCAAIAREVAAEKDAEIARLEAEARRLHDLRYERDAEILRLKVALAEPHKVSDAQRGRILALIGGALVTPVDVDILDRIVAIIESPADAEATT